MNYEIILTRQGKKDYEIIKKSPYHKKVKELFNLLCTNPIDENKCEELIGNLKGLYSVRINRQHRIVYKIHNDTMEVEIFSMWSHYENI